MCAHCSAAPLHAISGLVVSDSLVRARACVNTRGALWANPFSLQKTEKIAKERGVSAKKVAKEERRRDRRQEIKDEVEKVKRRRAEREEEKRLWEEEKSEQGAQVPRLKRMPQDTLKSLAARCAYRRT